MGQGYLKINLFLADHALPAENIIVLIRNSTGDLLYTLTADNNGITEKTSLNAPDIKNSQNSFGVDPPFATYDVEVPFSPGLKRVVIHNVQIFDSITSILPIQMHPAILGDTTEQNTDEIFIPKSHGVDFPRVVPGGSIRPWSCVEKESARANLCKPNNPPGSSDPPDPPGADDPPDPPGTDDPPDPPNADDPPDPPGDDDPPDPSLPSANAMPTTPVQANEVVIPSYITVHLGQPNAAASNLRLPFIDYIKNVASSEIFPTWEEAAIYANIYCQISFALNRVNTVWYRSRGFDFEITNSTAFDQFFVPGREIFENISLIVDNIFNMFLRRRGFREPFIAQYCNGTTSTCPGLSQWGSQSLAQLGYSTIEILHYYFPNDIQIVESNNFAEDVGVFGGVPLKEGSAGDDVRLMQTYLNRISGNFYIPAVGLPNGLFRSSTAASVTAFQRINNLIPDGIIGKNTWYSITKVYVGVRQLAELESEGERISIGAMPPAVVLSIGSRGPYVIELQFLLNFISAFFPVIPFVVEDGVFRDSTKRSVTEFQLAFGLSPDGVVGPQTWQKLYDVYWSIENGILLPHHYNNS